MWKLFKNSQTFPHKVVISKKVDCVGCLFFANENKKVVEENVISRLFSDTKEKFFLTNLYTVRYQKHHDDDDFFYARNTQAEKLFYLNKNMSLEK